MTCKPSCGTVIPLEKPTFNHRKRLLLPGNPPKYNWDHLDVGECFIILVKWEDAKRICRNIHVAAWKAGKQRGMKFAVVNARTRVVVVRISNPEEDSELTG